MEPSKKRQLQAAIQMQTTEEEKEEEEEEEHREQEQRGAAREKEQERVTALQSWSNGEASVKQGASMAEVLRNIC